MAREDTSDGLAKRLKSLTADMKRYVEKRLEILMLSAGEQMGEWIAWAIQNVAGVMLLIGGLVFLLVALALWLGVVLGSQSLGFVLVSLPLLAFGGIILYYQPRSLMRRIQQQFERELLRNLYDSPGEDGKNREQLPAKGGPDT